jgi:peptidyl-prolyl cis-trans isomerase SurA
MPLAVGLPSAPVRSETAVHVFMACERTDPEPDLPDRDEIAESIWDRQVEVLARRYVRDLRRDAVIDVR